MVTFEEFMKIEMRVGRIIKAEDFPEARKPAYKLTIDFGKELGIKKSSAQITDLYRKDELEGRHIIAVVNFPPRQVANIMSEVLVLGLALGKGVVLLAADKEVPLGTRVS